MTDARAGQPPRVGFVVSKAVGNSVIRHRTTRRLRALVGSELVGIPDGTDLVVRALPPAGEATSAQLAERLRPQLATVLARIGRRA